MPSSFESSKRQTHYHETPDTCVHLDQTPFDQFERDFLQIARMFFLSFHRAESHAWVNAFYSAEKRFNAPYGATIANAILMVVNTMRAARGSGFSYRDPNCETCREYITDEERYLIGTLHDVRQRNRSGARMNAMLLCQGEDDQAFMDAISRLAIIAGDSTAYAGHLKDKQNKTVRAI